MKTTISTYHYSNNVDLRNIGNMIRDYADEVENLEEENESMKEENEELKGEIEELKEKIGDLELIFIANNEGLEKAKGND